MHKVVANTTPIIALAGIGHLDLLEQLYGEIIIPRAVDREIISEPARSQVNGAIWIKVEDVKKPMQKSLFSSRFGKTRKIRRIAFSDNNICCLRKS